MHGVQYCAHLTMRDPIDTSGREQDEAAERRDVAIRRQQEVEDIKWLMAHAQGRRIVARIFGKTGIRRTPFHTSGSVMSFQAGAQSVGLWLEAEVLEETPEAYLRLLKEFARDN